MKEYVIAGPNDFISLEGYTLCIGNFDGVHLGHKRLIEYAKSFGDKVCAMTFDPHPMTFINDVKNPKYITPYNTKARLLENIGCNAICKVIFSKDFMKMSKDDFIVMLKKINPKRIICGYDFSFGYMGSGNPDDLKKAFETHVMDKFMLDDIRVSSTIIRDYLLNGDINSANRMLNRLYMISGIVVHGNALGRTIGFRTANIKYDDFILPGNGVYLCKIKYNNEILYGMANIGHNPTFNKQDDIRLEVNIFNFDEDIYDKYLEVFFVTRVRPEKKFNSKDELIEELKRNKEYGLSYFKLNN